MPCDYNSVSGMVECTGSSGPDLGGVGIGSIDVGGDGSSKSDIVNNLLKFGTSLTTGILNIKAINDANKVRTPYGLSPINYQTGQPFFGGAGLGTSSGLLWIVVAVVAVLLISRR